MLNTHSIWPIDRPNISQLFSHENCLSTFLKNIKLVDPQFLVCKIVKCLVGQDCVYFLSISDSSHSLFWLIFDQICSHYEYNKVGEFSSLIKYITVCLVRTFLIYFTSTKDCNDIHGICLMTHRIFPPLFAALKAGYIKATSR